MKKLSVKDNIGVGNISAIENTYEIINCAYLLKVNGFIKQISNTILKKTTNGVNLSEGQRGKQHYKKL